MGHATGRRNLFPPDPLDTGLAWARIPRGRRGGKRRRPAFLPGMSQRPGGGGVHRERPRPGRVKLRRLPRGRPGDCR